MDLIMDITASFGVTFHSGPHGITRMPAFANLASVTHFQRTKPHVPGRPMSVSFPLPSHQRQKDARTTSLMRKEQHHRTPCRL